MHSWLVLAFGIWQLVPYTTSKLHMFLAERTFSLRVVVCICKVVDDVGYQPNVDSVLTWPKLVVAYGDRVGVWIGCILKT